MANHNKGFTLIELLVVISIIALLSSVVLASLSSARNKAIVSQMMQQARQIALALNIVRNSSGALPQTTVAGSYVCLETPSVAPCSAFNTTYAVDSGVMSVLAPAISQIKDTSQISYLYAAPVQYNPTTKAFQLGAGSGTPGSNGCVNDPAYPSCVALLLWTVSNLDITPANCQGNYGYDSCYQVVTPFR